MPAEDRITLSLTNLHSYASPPVVLASREAALQRPVTTSDPIRARMTSEPYFFGPDSVNATDTGLIPEFFEVKRSGGQSKIQGAHHPAVASILKHRPSNPDPNDVGMQQWWDYLDDWIQGRNGRQPLDPAALDWHPGEPDWTACVPLGCQDWMHTGQRPENGGGWRIGMPQPPAYLFTDWYSRFGWHTNADTVIVILGGDGQSGWGQPVIDFYGAYDEDFVGAKDRCVITPHGQYLSTLLADPRLRQATPQDRALLDDLVATMWLDAPAWTRKNWPGRVHDAVPALALDASGVWAASWRKACSCSLCGKRRNGHQATGPVPCEETSTDARKLPESADDTEA